MKTVAAWVNTVANDNLKLNSWLSRQYVGEVLASRRIEELAAVVQDKFKRVIKKIAADEAKHAEWVLGLLNARKIPLPAIDYKQDRYWKAVLTGKENIEEVLGIGAHAEEMRLHRIKAIALDSRFDADIREVFSKILPDEEFHALAFAAAAGKIALKTTQKKHNAGLKALGLVL